ncbi:hypothetical protein NUSPORA_00514 [Nucleospora cyclopteri]
MKKKKSESKNEGTISIREVNKEEINKEEINKEEGGIKRNNLKNSNNSKECINNNKECSNNSKECSNNSINIINKEQIEKDRFLIKNNKSYINNSTFSYLRYINLKDSKKKNKPFNKVNPNNLTTLNLLYIIEEKLLYNCSKMFQLLKSREDLFESALQFISNRTIKDDLYYWVPGKKITNIFSLIKEAISDFGARYKECLIRDITMSNKEQLIKNSNILQFIMEKEDKMLVEEIEGIYYDLEIFKGKFITRSFWVPEENETAVNEVQKMNCTVKNSHLLPSKETVDISSNLSAFLVPEISFVDFEVNGERKVLSYKEFKNKYNN